MSPQQPLSSSSLMLLWQSPLSHHHRYHISNYPAPWCPPPSSFSLASVPTQPPPNGLPTLFNNIALLPPHPHTISFTPINSNDAVNPIHRIGLPPTHQPIDGLSLSATALLPSFSTYPPHGDSHSSLPSIAPSHFKNNEPSTSTHPAHTSPSHGLPVHLRPTSYFNGPNLYSHPHASPFLPQTLAHHNLAGPSHPSPVTVSPTVGGPLGSSIFGNSSYAPVGRLVQTWSRPPSVFPSNNHYVDPSPMDDNFHGRGHGHGQGG